MNITYLGNFLNLTLEEVTLLEKTKSIDFLKVDIF